MNRQEFWIRKAGWAGEREARCAWLAGVCRLDAVPMWDETSCGCAAGRAGR